MGQVVGNPESKDCLCCLCGQNHKGIKEGECQARLHDILEGAQVTETQGCEWCGFKQECSDDIPHSLSNYPYILHEMLRSPGSIQDGKQIREKRHEERMCKITNRVIVNIARDQQNKLGPMNPTLKEAVIKGITHIKNAVKD